jgi:hypothetical protein
MIVVKAIKNSNISQEELTDICKIKSAFGDYSFESQVKWINENIKSNDMHFLVYENNKLIAYANLIEEFLEINQKEVSILGLGNVCTFEKGQGKGKLLMEKINEYLLANKKIGLLFCKPALVSFYSKNNWKSISPDFSDKICWMKYNAEYIDFKNVSYIGKLF